MKISRPGCLERPDGHWMMSVPASYLSALFAPALNRYAGLATTMDLTNISGTPDKAAAIRNMALAKANKNKRVSETMGDPEVKRDIAAFRLGVAKATTVSGLLSDSAVMKVLLTANGLGDQIANTALARKALQSDPANANSLVNKLSDRRWKNVAQVFQFMQNGLASLHDPKVTETLSHAYAEVTWRKSLDKTTPGLSDALSFREQAGKLTSALQILGDPLLRRVVTTTLRLPLEIALQSLDAQQSAITTRLDIARLQDPKFVEKFSQRYLLAAADKAASDATASATSSAYGGFFI